MTLIHNKIALTEFVQQRLIPRMQEKKLMGEVFTPLNLIEEIMNKLEKYNPTCFSDPNKKWLDPAAGMGNFMVVIYDRLMKGLAKLFPDEMKRSEHIITNMLFMYELNPRNVEWCREIFSEKASIYQGDTLQLDPSKYYKTVKIGNLNVVINQSFEGFDYIVGNPPFSSNSTGRATGNTIWPAFVRLAIKMLKSEGFLCFIHPSGWRKPESEKSKYNGLFHLLTKQNQMLYLEIHDIKDGQKVFGCGTRYDWYVVKKKEKYTSTDILFYDNSLVKVNLSLWKWLPNGQIDIIGKILASDSEEKCPIIYNRSNYGSDKKYISKIMDDIHRHPIIKAIPKSGINYLYSSDNTKGHFGISKVIFGDNGFNDCIIDIGGDYGMSEHSMAIKIDNLEEGKLLKTVLTSQNFKTMIVSCTWSNFQIDWRLFTYFKRDFYRELI